MDSGFKPRGGAGCQNLGHFCEVLLWCGKVFTCLYLDSQSSKKHSYLEHAYVHAIFIPVVVAMVILHSAMPSRVHIGIAVFVDRSAFLSV